MTTALLKHRLLTVSNVVIAVLLVLVPFFAFLSVSTSALVGHFVLVRLWDEYLLAILVLLTTGQLIINRRLRQTFLHTPLLLWILLYVAYVIVLGVIALADHQVGLKAAAYGMLLDTRFLFWFVAVWIIGTESPWLKAHWQHLIFWSLAAVAIFGLLQFFVLPDNFLIHFGYGSKTYVPYITINQNSPTIRIQSFLRGANPLGMYLGTMVGLLGAVLAFRRRDWYRWLLMTGAILALFLSFSRSGWVVAAVGVALAVWWRLKQRRQRVAVLSLAAAAVLVVGGILLVMRHNTAVQDALLHVSSHSTALVTSNQGHLATFERSIAAGVHHPLGLGPGAAGQASWYNRGHPIRNTESYLLQLADEIGWPGVLGFLAICGALALQLWRRRADPLAIGLLAVLVGITIASLVDYAWTDDTLAYTWFGLAAITLSSPRPEPDSSVPDQLAPSKK